MSGLEVLSIPNSVETIGDMAFRKTKIVTVSLSNRISNIPKQAFNQCEYLSSVYLPYGIKYIGDEAFGTCKSLTSLSMPESLIEIGESAFSHCRSLTSITIPKGVMSIGKFAFGWCDYLSSINLPVSMKKGGFDIFAGCKNLKYIYCNIQYPQECVVDWPKERMPLILYIPKGTRVLYEEAGWGKYFNSIVEQ